MYVNIRWCRAIYASRRADPGDGGGDDGGVAATGSLAANSM